MGVSSSGLKRRWGVERKALEAECTENAGTKGRKGAFEAFITTEQFWVSWVGRSEGVGELWSIESSQGGKGSGRRECLLSHGLEAAKMKGTAKRAWRGVDLRPFPFCLCLLLCALAKAALP